MTLDPEDLRHGHGSSEDHERLLARAASALEHQALWATCRSCLIEAPAGPARAEAVSGAAPRRISPYADQSAAGLPAVAIVEGRVATVTPQLTGDRRGVFTDYEVVVARVAQDARLLPVQVGQTVVVTRPGGRVEWNGQVRVVSVAGYPAVLKQSESTGHAAAPHCR